MTIDQQIAEKEVELSKLKHAKRLLAKQFILKEGYVFYTKGSISSQPQCRKSPYIEQGAARATEKLAVEALDAMVLRNRIEAYARQIDPKFKEVWDGNTKNYMITLHQNGKYSTDSHWISKRLGTVYMNQETASSIADALNKGVIVL